MADKGGKFDERIEAKDEPKVELGSLQVDTRYLIVVPISFIDFTLKDEAGNPCAFFKYELVFPRGEGGKARTFKGYLDENGRVFIKPLPSGEYKFTFSDPAGRPFKMAEFKPRQEPSAGRLPIPDEPGRPTWKGG